MLTPADVLRLPYDPTLTQAGIEYAKKSLHYTYNRMGLSTASRLRKIVAGVAVELAFRRWLSEAGVGYDVLGATAFTDKDKYDLRLGGRRCDLKSFLISDKTSITEMRRDPQWLLEAAALVPEDQFRSQALGENDLYLFGFFTGLETRHQTDLHKALAAGQPTYLLFTPEAPEWCNRQPWQTLGRLIFKSNAAEPITVEIGGQNAPREAITEGVPLAPRTRTVTQQEFYSLLYLHTATLPSDLVGVRSPALHDTLVVSSYDWHNIWVYGLSIFLVGWLTKAEFRQVSQKIPAGATVKQYRRTHTDNVGVLVRHLRPIAELVQHVKNSGW